MPEGTTIAIIATSIVVFFVIIFAIKGLKIISQAQTMVIERLGKYHRTLSSGVNIIWPIIDKPRKIMWRWEEIPVGSERAII
ncbi:MAG: SPFH domain-containing protein, partial [Planctomycetota bacterium]